MSGPNETRSIRERIEERLSDLGQKQRLVAEFVLANPSKILFATAGELAVAAEVDPATVVRFAQSIGFKGFPEFRDVLRTEFPMLRPAPQLIEDEITITGSQELADLTTIVDRARSRSEANLEATYARLDPKKLGDAADAFLAAERVIVVGAGQSEVLSLHLRRLLQIAGIKVEPVADWYDLVYSVSSFGPEDVLFATSAWHYSAVTMRTIKQAKEVGARVIVLTDEPFSPTVSQADIALFYGARAVGEYMSPFAGIVMLDCIAAMLAARVPDRVKRGMEMQSRIMSHHNLSIS
jgi:DNA-binding MurR/RpiR family transcriptional regulator